MATKAGAQIAFLLFEDVNAQDLSGPYEVLRYLPGSTVSFVGLAAGPVRAEGGLTLVADKRLDEVSEADVVVVPGGSGELALRESRELARWLQAAHARGAYIVSVCTGALLLGAAGLLTGKRATTHWMAKEELAQLGATVVDARYVFDGKIVTAAGVSAGIDMALALLAELHSPALAQGVQLGIEYDPKPPFTAGSPATAPAPLVERVLAHSRFKRAK